ncbi:MAG: hypothetical protein M3384_08730 [Acidobacteriota bacterium]|nr:hypothetical protein [Acidobacteriota bacterium]
MAPRVEEASRNQEIYQPKPVEAKIEKTRTVEVTLFSGADKNLFLRQNNLRAETLKISLFARFEQANVRPNPVAPTASQTDPKKIEDAVNLIKDRLSESFLGDVSHGDLSDIRGAFRNLNGAEATEVFRRLSDGDLQKWADELDGALGSFSTDEKKALFNDLAGKLDDQQLARFINALGDEGNIQSLADSVADNASGATKAALINRMTANVEKDERAAIAVAELIGGMSNNPRELESVLQNLSQTQLTAIMRAASQEEIHTTASPYGGGSVYTTFEPAPLVDMLNAVSRTGNAELKANVFQAAAMELKRIEEAGGLLNPVAGRGGAARDVRNALTGLLRSDTTGIMTALEHDFRNGDGISAYVKSMMNAGETTELGNIIARLSKGNDLRGDPLARFGAQVRGTDGNPHYRNAQVLGYFAGALFSGAKQITSDRSRQADILKNVFGTIAGATGAANPASGVVSSILNGLTQQIVADVTNGLNKGTMEMEEALEQLIFPRNPQTGDTYEGAAEADYDSAFSRVVLRNS